MNHVTNGAKSAIYSALSATVEPGDVGIIPAPYWVSYPTWCSPATVFRNHRLRRTTVKLAPAQLRTRHHRKERAGCC